VGSSKFAGPCFGAAETALPLFRVVTVRAVWRKLALVMGRLRNGAERYGCSLHHQGGVQQYRSAHLANKIIPRDQAQSAGRVRLEAQDGR